jgi:DNA modification methylase
MPTNPALFRSTMIPAPDGSGKLFEEHLDAPSQPVTCLGKSFASNDERRAYFTEELRKHLADPEFRKIEGFPIGKDEDIIALSDPPYYTPCPNPWLQDFIAEWENQKYKSQAETPYHREPFTADVSEGKNDPIYNAHSYHTKVPHKAIMRYILHYTNPGDIVFDGFCGTGMTGVAAQMCANRAEVESLGYKVEDDGTILQEETDEKGEKHWEAFSRLGARKAVLNDLSPAATFIAYNYNTPVDVVAFEKEAKRILAEVEAECGWMYETTHTDSKTKGKINYTVWSDVYSCPQCSAVIIFYDHVFYNKNGKIIYQQSFKCPKCGVLCSKNAAKNSHENKLERIMETIQDKILDAPVKKQKKIPVRINYSIGTNRYEKLMTEGDIEIITKALEIFPFDTIPSARMIAGDEARRNDTEGLTHTHHFYMDRTLVILSKINKLIKNNLQLFFLMGSFLPKLTIFNRYMPQHGGRALVGPMANTLYVPPVCVENNVIDQYRFQVKKIIQALNNLDGSIIATQASQKLNVTDESCDYLFIDPPFGANIMYSELSFIREAWLKVFTNSLPEAIENKTQRKGSNEYRLLMLQCFREAYRILKKGHWMTVEFSNTKSSVWNNIQTALSDAGFIVANVAVLDKTRGGLHSMLGTTAVKQDLVISAYKPNGGFEERFIKEAETEEGVWDFIRTHLRYLSVVKTQNKELISVNERQPRILFDQVVAYYVRKGIQIPIASSQAFQAGLKEKFDERDGMYFLHEQALEYDKKKLQSGGLKQSELFVINEESAIQWLKILLSDKPRAIQDIYPDYMQKLTGFDKKEEKLELRTLLEQNFIEDNNSGKWHVPDPENAVHVEKIREKALLKEFENYKNASRRLKVFRIEAVRAGFKKAYGDRDYETILKIADKLSGDAIEEDPMLLMWYTSARTRMGED